MATTSSILAKLAVIISANNAEFNRKIAQSQKSITGFTGTITKMAGTLGIAFGIREVARFAIEISELAGRAQAVGAAFERLPASTQLMRDLKEATGNTVSELELMKRAVQASNFDISLQALPKLLEFATLRAQQTGQSVDYLVDSIVTGIGRKSKLILDNLGISAVQLNEALGDTAIGAASIGQVADAVGKIIDKNLENMNDFMDNNATKLQKLAASWENYKVAVGEAANETGLLGGSIDAIRGSLDILSTKDLTFFEKLKAFLSGPGGAAAASTEAFRRELERLNKEQKQAEFVTKQVDKAFAKFKGNIDEFAKAISPNHPLRGKFLEEFKKRLVDSSKVQITNLEALKNKEKELLAQFQETDIKDKAKLQNLAALTQATREQIKAIEDLLKAESATGDPLSEWNRKNSIFREGPSPWGDVVTIKNASKDFAIAVTDPLKQINEELKINSSAWDEWLSGVRARQEIAAQVMADHIEKTNKLADVATTVGSSVGEIFGDIAAGEQNLAQTLAHVTEQIVTMFLKQSIAAIIAASIKDPSTPFPFAKIAIAAAGIAGVKALFGKIGGSSGEAGGGINQRIGSGNERFGELGSQGIEITLGGEFRVQGPDLVYIFNRTQQLQGRTRG